MKFKAPTQWCIIVLENTEVSKTQSLDSKNILV